MICDFTPTTSLTVPVLKDMLRKRGLKVSGKKAELIDRLDQAVLAESGVDPAKHWIIPIDSYDDMKERDNELRGFPRPLLKGMLRQRGLDVPVECDKDYLIDSVLGVEFNMDVYTYRLPLIDVEWRLRE